jgi:hypothetical protein
MTTDEQQAELDRLAAMIERLDHTANAREHEKG